MRILSIDGGGYLGLATAAFLEETERHFGTTYHDHFDLFCGTSTGAIIALGLASGKTGKEIAALYQAFGTRVFRNPLPASRHVRTVLGLVLARYSNQVLQKALADAFGEMTLGDLRAKNKFVLITAFSITNGKPRIFKTNHAADLTRDDDYRVCDIALASAAAPVYLPLVKLQSPTNGVEEWFCDGGVFANHPALLGYAEAVSHLGIHPDDIHILSLSTPRADLAEHASARSILQQFLLSRGLILWGSKLASVMIDSTSCIAHETLRRLAGWQPEERSRYVRIELRRASGLDLDIATPRATTTLRQIGAEYACRNEIRDSLAPFFRE